MQKKPDVELLGPSPFTWKGSLTIWAIAAGLLAVVWWSAWHSGIGTPGNGWGGLCGLSGFIFAYAALLQYLALADRGIVLSVEGVRRGKGPRSAFTPWLGATVIYDRKKDRFVVTSKGKRIVFSWASFSDIYRYRDIMEHVLHAIYEQSFRRHGKAPKIEAPIHSLSDADKAEFLNYKGDGFYNKVWPYLSAPLFVACLVYWGFIELLIHHPRVGPDIVRIINFILRTFPVLFRRPAGPFLYSGSILMVIFIALDRIPYPFGHKRLKRFRLNWLEQFGKSQRVAISEIGLTQQDSDGPSFWVWNDITRVSRTNGLILFHVAPAQTLSIIVPKRVFATPADAEAFCRQACAFKRAARTRPSLVEPISFWEIA